MHTYFVYGILGLVEGLTEFVPVSSSGHLIVAHQILGATGPNALAVDAVLQLGAILAVIIYFFPDLWKLAMTGLRWVMRQKTDPQEVRLLFAIIIGTIPGVVFGLLLEKMMETIFRNTHLVAYSLIAGSLIFVAAEWALRKRREKRGIEKVSLKDGIIVGLWQCLALDPGMSRSGMTISGALFLGMDRETAARFSFLLAIPIIAGSGAKKLLDLAHGSALSGLGAPLLFGTFVAFVSGFLAISWLLRFLKKHPLYVFAAYRILVALAILAFIPAF